jgi:uncharacterized membrane protein
MDRRPLRLALIASLALNAFLAAAFVATLMLAREVIRNPAGLALRQAARSLDDSHRAAFVSLMRADGHTVRSANQQARALRRSVWADLQRPGFDPPSAKARLAQARALNQQSRALVEDSVVDFAAALPVDQRAALGRSLERMTPTPRRRRVTTPGAPASPAPDSSATPHRPA